MKLTLTRNPRNPNEPNKGDATTPAGWWPYRIDGVAGRAYVPANWFPGAPPETVELVPEKKELERS